MHRVDGTLAKTFDFGAESAPVGRTGDNPRLRLASSMRLAGPHKYKVLEARRRRAQLKARRQLDLLDAQEIER